ncbi:hypothetical protein LCGC14_2351130 [marine sediment metagenome]|uniref:DUF4595 domain-containing protein n=1 Tax=marine sediment metagenome TaxID=412755 RepID=A0A0F9C939_9ZZZZ
MKSISIALFIFILLAGCTSVPKKGEEQKVPAVSETEEETQEIKNPRQTEAEQGGINDPENELGDKEKIEEAVVKEVALIAKEISYYSDGMLDEYTVYFYKENSTEILKEEVYSNMDEIIERYVYKYQNGNIVKKGNLNPDGDYKSSKVYEYNDRNLLESESRYDENGKAQSVSKYEYDADNNKIKWSLYDAGRGQCLLTIPIHTKIIKTRESIFIIHPGNLKNTLLSNMTALSTRSRKVFFSPMANLKII